MSDEIVISGISGRFPECDSLDEFKRKLYDSESPITYDERKWPKNYRYKFGKNDIPYGTGKFKNIDRYDNIVFAISPVLANQIDIINRMVLEPSFEAVFDAGINPYSLMGANVGCYFTSGISEVENIKLRTNVERLSLIGGSKGMLSNRVSFALNLTGPSITFYTAAYGGLEALSHAYENLITKRIDGAIVGSSASHVDPKLSINYQLMGYLSPDGTTKVFDADAEGFGRSDCVVILYLQRASDAKRSYGSLLFSETIFRGLSLKSFLGFDETFLEETLRAMYAKHKNVDPKDISFVEMDANGVKHIDQREALAVSKMFCNRRDSSLLIGSVKSHSGHTETSAGYLSIIKACLALDSGIIAPNMYYTKPNPNIEPLVEKKIKVVTEPTVLPGSIVAVNSFTLTGSISHAVIKQNHKKDDPSDNLPRLLVLCGRMKDDLMAVIKKIESEPLNKEFVAITNDIFKTPIPSHMYRGYTVLSTASGNTISDVETIGGENRPIWFVFSGMGSQWNGMGKDLLRIPVFAQVIDECDTILKPKGIDIYNILTTDDPTIFDDIIHAFVGIVAVQIGLVRVMDTIGIKPDGLIGHSLGETACAYADGSLTMEQAVLASYERGAVSNETETIKGMMAAIGIGHHEVKSMLPEEIEVACHNAPDNCTLSGPSEKVIEFVTKLQQKNIFAKSVNVSNRAYHSRYVHPAAPLLLTRLKAIIPEPKERSSKWISTSVPEDNWNESLVKTSSAAYFTNNFINPVLFEEGCKHIPEHAIILEIAPHGLLQAILKRSLSSTITKLSLTLRSERAGGVPHLLSTIGKLFIAGCQPDVNALYPKIEYPVSRGTPNTASIATWDHSRKWDVPGILTDTPLADEIFEVKLTRGCDYMFLKAHTIRNYHIIPPSFYMYITWFIFSLLRREELGASNIIFEDIRIRKHLYVTIDKPRSLSVMIQGSGNFEVRLEGTKDNGDKTKIVMTGMIYVPYEKVNILSDKIQTSDMKFELNGKEFYKHLQNAGYHLQDCFNDLVREVKSNETECVGKIIWNGNWICFLDTIMKINMYSMPTSRGQLFFPKRIRKVTIGVSVFKTLKPGDELIYKKDVVIDKFCCNGLELSNFIYGPEDLPFLSSEKTDIVIQERNFISYSNPNIENMNTYLIFCLQLVYDCATCAKTNLHIVDTTGNIERIVRSITETNKSLMKPNTVFSDMSELTSRNYSIDKFHLVVVNSYCSVNKLHHQLKNKFHNLFVLVINSLADSDSLKDKNTYIEITHKIFNDTNVQLFRKLSPSKCHLPSVMIADEHWPTTLAPSLRSKKSESVVLLRYSIESSDLNFILSEQKQFSNIRCLFVMDEQPPTFSVKNSFYKNQILQDLPVSVLRNGEWGQYWTLDAESFVELDHMQPQDFKLINIDMKYFTVDIEMVNTDQCARKKEFSFGLEFSGISNSKTRVMGFGYYSPNRMKSRYELDDQLVWSVPEHWSFEDAASVPLIYSQVYYILVLNATKERSFQSILVNSNNLSFVEAILNITSLQNLTAYVVVADVNDAQLLMKKFPNLTKSQFLDRNDCKYEIEIKSITKGEGVDIVINCLTDIQNINATANCLKLLGKFVDLTNKQYKDEQQFGMYTFLKSVTYVTAPHNVQALLRLPSEQKKRLHDLIDNDIRTGLIRPVSRNVTKYKLTKYSERNKEITNVKEIVASNETNLQTEKPVKQLKWDENRSYMIISGGKRTEFWFELLQWLVDRGVRKFLIILENFVSDPSTSRQINRLIAQKNATIVLTTSKKVESVDAASELIMKANNIAPLEAVFFVSLGPADRTLANFDTACRNGPSCCFISLFSGTLLECERRRHRGESTVFLCSKKDPETLTPILRKLEHLLKEPLTKLSPSFYELKERPSRKGAIPTEINLEDFISIDMQKLINIGYYATEQPEFIEITTRSKKLSEIKNLRPLFIVPAIDANFVQSLARKLLYPAFCATFSEQSEPPTMTAEKLFEKLKEIQSTGPITIIGETWNSPVAIELALLVQAAERKVELFLIEGDPITWKKCIERLGKIRTKQFDDNYLRIILRPSELPQAESEKTESNSPTWEENHNNRLKNLECSFTSKCLIAKTVNGIRNRLINLVTYLPSSNFLNHAVLFKHRPSDRSLEQYCWSDDIYLFKEDKYETFLSNEKLLNIIHNDTLFSWFS